MNPHDIAVLAGCILLFTLFSGKLEGGLVTPPMLAVAAGLLLGPATGIVDVHLSNGALHLLAELTLILVLFADATRIDLKVLRREVGLPVRLLGIGLPLCMALGALIAKWMFPQLPWWEAAALGAILAPTDAALGQAVVSSPKVPLRIRQALNVESGLNDGIALPFVLIFAALASVSTEHARTAQEWVVFTALQVTLGPLMGWLIAFVGGRLLTFAIDKSHVEESAERLAGPALALLCFAGAEVVGGNGFIAAFVGGVTLGTTQQGRCKAMLTFLEAEGQLLMLVVFFGLGASLAMPAIMGASVSLVVYALLSLTAARQLPVIVSLLGTGLRAPSFVFLGWFGPRGLASILYAVIVVSEAALPHQELVFNAVVLTALLSVVLHGLTAAPGANWYGPKASDPRDCPEENAAATELPTRKAPLPGV